MYATTGNPDIRSPAEAALDSLGDKRSAAIVGRGYDLLETWFAADAPKSSATSVAAPLPPLD